MMLVNGDGDKRIDGGDNYDHDYDDGDEDDNNHDDVDGDGEDDHDDDLCRIYDTRLSR